METKLTLPPLLSCMTGRIRIGTCKHRKGIYMIKGTRWNNDICDYEISDRVECNCGDRTCYEDVHRLTVKIAAEKGILL